jgi:amiloride-sensitive sodium channel subunit gamma
MLLDCSYNGINCSSNFVRSLTSVFGNCFTFNWKASMEQLYALNDMGTAVVLFEGLSLTFYVPRQLSFPLTNFSDGLVLMLHDNDELPFIAQNGLWLQPGLAHTITYTKSQTTFLSMPYTSCTSLVEADLRALYETTFNSEAVNQVTYSESACYELCLQS